MNEKIESFSERKKIFEARRIEQRTRFDLRDAQGIRLLPRHRNYSRQLSGRAADSHHILYDYFPEDFLIG